ncbi:GNAT family N-acetyltransferase [Desulfoluna spongiiphila]|uniref:GNAT family N-acetyltransferase n=1 Tax=Desulfoluna spongiiphila TaxID=419481 RepID=UPI00125F3E9A|nr:GNAT family N-acetyltransferase [Desulfoluna spongiiphila]
MISIAKADVSDAFQIWKIQKSAFEGQAKIYNNYKLPPLIQTLESLKDEFEEKVFLKAEIDSKIVGSVRFTVDGNEIDIERLIVDPNFQNQGVGTILMKRVEQIADKKVTFKLFTGIKSRRNIHLYEKLGYTIYTQSETPQGIELLYMQKTSW